jgi:hypothetical protein
MEDLRKQIEQSYTIPCGPFTIRADAVCRKRFKDKYDLLLDRLTKDAIPKDAYMENLQGNGKLLQDISGRIG